MRQTFHSCLSYVGKLTIRPRYFRVPGLAIPEHSVRLCRPISSTSSRSERITLVLFDAFDTLITPRIPIHEQYAEEATRAGLTPVDGDRIRAAFKVAFRKLDAEWPNYGKGMRHPKVSGNDHNTDQVCESSTQDDAQHMTVELWWNTVIERSLIGSGLDEQAVRAAMPTLGRTLMKRFESDQGYRAFDDSLPGLAQLANLNVKIGVVSNADDRIVHTLSALGIARYLNGPVITSYAIGHAKPDPKIFWAACERAGISSDGADQSKLMDLSEVLMVGDELEADYRGALRAGLQAALIRRPGAFSDGAKRQKAEDEQVELQREGVRTVKDIGEVVDIVRQSRL